MRIPDYISPIIGWRVWRWDGSGLKSLNGEVWMPGEPLRAGCRASESGTLIGRGKVAFLSHDAPQMACTCGIYGSKTLDRLRWSYFWQYGGIHGEVNLWGVVVEHEDGFRAEVAYPRTLYLSPKVLPVTVKEIQTRIQSLIGYGCDLFVSNNYSAVPLWRKNAAFDAAGLDFLMSRGREWYARRRQQRTITKGDRVAILGRGIAIIEEIRHEHVHVTVWNRSVFRILRKDIVWNKQNMRWETEADAVTTYPAESGARQ